jgi:hypothetical protein
MYLQCICFPQSNKLSFPVKEYIYDHMIISESETVGVLNLREQVLVNASACAWSGNIMDWQVISIQEYIVACTIMFWSHLQINCRFKVGFNRGVSYSYISHLTNKYIRSHLLNQCVGACYLQLPWSMLYTRWFKIQVPLTTFLALHCPKV